MLRASGGSIRHSPPPGHSVAPLLALLLLLSTTAHHPAAAATAPHSASAARQQHLQLPHSGGRLVHADNGDESRDERHSARRSLSSSILDFTEGDLQATQLFDATGGTGGTDGSVPALRRRRALQQAAVAADDISSFMSMEAMGAGARTEAKVVDREMDLGEGAKPGEQMAVTSVPSGTSITPDGIGEPQAGAPVRSVDPSAPPSRPPPYHGCNDTAMLDSLHVPVVEVWRASRKFPGFHDIVSDADQEHVYALQLEPDIAHWRGRGLTMAALDKVVAQTRMQGRPSPDTMRRVAIVGNRLYFLDQHKPPFNQFKPVEAVCVQPCNAQLFYFERQMRRFLIKNTFPDVVFEYSVNDYPSCRIKGRSDKATRPEADAYIDDCAAPVFSMQKTDSYADILIPILHDIVQPLMMFPQHLKSPKAFLRATAFCDQPHGPHQGLGQCARSYFTRRTLYGTWGPLVESGLTTGYGLGSGEQTFDLEATRDGPLPALGFFPLVDHARFKILLDTDGVVGAFRSSKLMHMNSAVFKQKTPYYEWYGKLLRDGEHYVSFWQKDKDDVFDLLKEWRFRDAELQNISFNAMHLVYRYTSPRARMLYWRKALTMYKELFPDMDAYIAALNIPDAGPQTATQGGRKRTRGGRGGGGGGEEARAAAAA